MNKLSGSLRADSPAPARFTADEFLRMAGLGAFNDMKVELDHGEIVRMNPPHNDHAFTLGTLMRALFAAVDMDPFVVVPEIAVVLPDETVRAFDAAIVSSAAMAEKVLSAEHVLLAIEISDTTLHYDLGVKLRDYAAAGIPNYWVVDVKARAIHVMTVPSGSAYQITSVVRFGEPLELPEGLGTIVLG
jgi:Uma2 family endonuclease